MFRITCLAVLAWLLFMASPFLALHSLAGAVERRDAAAVAERVNLRAVRASLTKQIVDEYLVSVGRGQEIGAASRGAASGMGATLADPIVAQMLTPQALVALLEDGWPDEIAGPGAPNIAGSAGFRIGLDWASLQKAGRIFMASETRGFRKAYIPLATDVPPQERLTLYLRLGTSGWRLTGLQLPTALRQRLIKDLPRPSA